MATRKLTALQADLIREESAQGASQRQLAQKYGVSQMAIWQVLSGKTYVQGKKAA